MSLSDWIMLGGVGWVLKKVAAVTVEAAEDYLRQQGEELKRIAMARAEEARKDEINTKRKNTPCRFRDGIPYKDFCDLAHLLGEDFKRIKKVSVNGASVFCTVESLTGYSNWEFNVDFNDWGHITGARWTQTDNPDSSIPERYGSRMTSAILRMRSNRNIHLEDYAAAVDDNTTLETETGLEFHRDIGLFKRLFTREQNVISRYDSCNLVGEHIYPVVSFLKSNGFCNVKSVPIKDVGHNSGNYLFEVEQIVIDGNSFFEEGDVFTESSEVIITYHEKLEIMMPFTVRHFKKRNYIEVGDELQELGFSEIYEEAIHDLTTGWLVKDESVEQVLISGNELEKNEVYSYDEEIVIKYHTF